MHMSFRTRGVGLFILVLALGTSGAVATAQEESRHVLEGREVAVYNLAGHLVIHGGEGTTAVIVRREGPDSARLEIESGRLDDRPTLRVIFPDDRVVYPALGRGSSTYVQVRDDGTFGGGLSRGHRVHLSGSGSGLEAWADLEVSLAAGTSLRAYLAGGEVTVENVAGDIRVDTNMGGVTASKVRGYLLVDTGSGSVDVTDVEGEVDIDTGSGNVTLSRIRGERVRVDTGSGKVVGADIQVTHLEADTGSGRIDLREVTGEVLRLDTGSGAVALDLLSAVRSLVIDTGSGGVTLGLSEAVNAELEIDIGSGSITVDVPMKIRKKSRSYVLGMIGEGEGNIYIDTGSGSVRVVRRR
jgi:hypothetical protein